MSAGRTSFIRGLLLLITLIRLSIFLMCQTSVHSHSKVLEHFYFQYSALVDCRVSIFYITTYVVVLYSIILVNTTIVYNLLCIHIHSIYIQQSIVLYYIEFYQYGTILWYRVLYKYSILYYFSILYYYNTLQYSIIMVLYKYSIQYSISVVYSISTVQYCIKLYYIEYQYCTSTVLCYIEHYSVLHYIYRTTS